LTPAREFILFRHTRDFLTSIPRKSNITMQYGQPLRLSYRLRLTWLECLFFSCALSLAGVMVWDGAQQPASVTSLGYKVQMARLQAEQPVVASTNALPESIFSLEPSATNTPTSR
jgi:hypothetical protein